MNTIIIYSSKYGCTSDCAKYLKSGSSGLVMLTDIDKINSNTINLENYSTVIFGSSIYIGAISKKMRKFCNENIDLLDKKRVGIFICCAFPEQIKEYLATNFPSKLLKSAVTIKDFGGEARIDKMKFIDKLITKAVIKGNHENLKISHENMDNFKKELDI